MTADLLEAEGWNVLYLGANTPQKELLRLLKRVKPKILGISVTMVFNLLQAEEIITCLREEEDL
ncbi:MAG: cobalamin-dependent protein, partial [Candidatus Caldatribacteriaceae bacterium]